MTAITGRKPSRYVPIATDGGWGYVVVFGSFLIHVIADGIVYAFGVMATALMHHFEETNARVSIIVSLLVGLTLASGPIASAITNKIGCRLTTIAGAIVAGIGLMAASFSTSLEMIMVTAGAICGVGFGLIYCPAIVIVTMYFEKYRALATGIAVCGAGVGTAVISPLQEYLIQHYSWQFCMRVNSGLALLCVIAGLTFAPLEFKEVYDDEENDDTPTENQVENINEEVTDKQIMKDNSEKKSLLDVKNIRPAISHQDISDASKTGNLKKAISHADSLHKSRSNTVTDATGYLNVKDSFYQGSVTNLPEYQENRDKFRSISSLQSRKSSHVQNEGKKIINEEDEKQLVSQSSDDDNDGNTLMDTLKSLTDFGLLKDPIFMMFAVSNFLTSVGFNAPMAFLPSHGEKLGLAKEEASLIMSAWGVCNTVGRILFGIVSDRKLPFRFGKNLPRNRLWIYNISLIINGMVTACCFFFTSFYGIVAFGGFIGLTISSYVCLTSVILVDLLGVDKLTNAFGLLLLFQGIATFAGPPIAGMLADMTQSYIISFIMCGVCVAVSGAMLFGVPSLQRKLNRVPKDTNNS
uniref:EG:103B4.3 protein (inferred by orthology to a D. melanogaster protein) n=1 Tax=Strongyloides venezuelensis TaxID=75913 RepID=A0A0K0EU83_STRVS